MGDVIDRKPPQWQKKDPVEEGEDAMILSLARNVMHQLTDGAAPQVVPTVVQLAVLKLVQRAVLGNYHAVVPEVSLELVMDQARDMASRYAVTGADGKAYD